MNNINLHCKIGNHDVISIPRPHHSDRGDATAKMLVVQCMGAALQDVYAIYDEYNASPHFFIPQATAAEMKELMPDSFADIEFEYPNSVPILMFVSPQDSAWAIGESNFADFNNEPGCENGLEPCAISIAFHSPGYGDDGDWFKFGNFTEGQQKAGLTLISNLVEKYDINPVNIFGHSTVSDYKMTTPGKNFFWKELHDAGYGYLPTPKALNTDLTADEMVEFTQNKLEAIGFNQVSQTGQWDEATQKALCAFMLQYGQALFQDDINADALLGYGKGNITSEVLETLNGFDTDVFHNLNDVAEAV